MAWMKAAGSSAVENVLAYTVFAALATAVMIPAIVLKATDMIDNLWTIAVARADIAGKELARALLSRKGDTRAVTLVGFSLGSRVIFSCLKELAILRYKLKEKKTSSNSATSPTVQSSSSPSTGVSAESPKQLSKACLDIEQDEDDSVCRQKICPPQYFGFNNYF